MLIHQTSILVNCYNSCQQFTTKCNNIYFIKKVYNEVIHWHQFILLLACSKNIELHRHAAPSTTHFLLGRVYLSILLLSVSSRRPRKDLSDIHLTNCLIGQRVSWCERKHDLSQEGGSPQRTSGALIATDKSPRKRILHAHMETYLQVHWSAMIKTWEGKGGQWSGKQAPLGLFYS